LFGLLTVWLLLRFATELAGPRAGVAAAAFYAVTPLAIYYSAEGRNYAMLAFTVLLAVRAAYRATSEYGTTRDWVLHGAAVALSLYVHYISAPVVLVGMALVVTAGWRRHLKGWLLSMVGAAVAFVPWAAVAAQQVGDIGDTLGWLVPFWERYPPQLAIPLSLLAFMPGGQVPPFVGLATVDWLQPALAVGVAAIVALVLLPRALFLRPISRQVRVLALGSVLLPLVVPFLYSFHTPVYLVGRSDFTVFPCFCLLAGVAWARLRARPVAIGAVVLMTVVCLVAWPAYFGGTARTHEREKLQQLAQSMKPGDLVLCTDLTRPTAQYQLGRLVSDLRFESFPREVAKHSAVVDRESYQNRPELLAQDAEQLVALVRELERDNTAWLLQVEHPMNAPLVRAFAGQNLRLATDDHYRLNQLGIQVRIQRVVGR
ncbi:MAG: glycosyltransferase family 39 protein, partial [Deltaproteobacteria bacterium]|nr:glycosyltransferase family 39 protein [Deltaproteobacteria bacterium]